MRAGVFAAVYIALFAAHQVADHWIQRQVDADTKHKDGLAGWLANLTHVATYTLTCAVALDLADWRLGLHLSPGAVLIGLAVSAVTHSWADRRHTLRWLADKVGSGAFYRVKSNGTNGAYLLDLLCTTRQAVA